MKRSYIIIGLLMFVVLGYFASRSIYLPSDLYISQQLQQIHFEPFSIYMRMISLIGYQPFIEMVAAMIFIVLIIIGRLTDAVFSSFIALSSTLIGMAAKAIVNRPRPTEDLVNIVQFLKDQSFPSNHVLVYTVYFGFFFYLARTNPKSKFAQTTKFVCILLISTIGLSRIYLGAHWASDVLGGYLLGSTLLYLSILLYKKIPLKQNKK